MRRVATWLVLSLTQAWVCRSQTTLAVPSITQQQVTPGQAPLALSIPEAPTALNLSVVLCSLPPPYPRFFVSNSTGNSDPSIDDAGEELLLDAGVAFWNGTGPATFYAFTDTGTSGSRFFEVGITTGGEFSLICFQLQFNVLKEHDL